MKYPFILGSASPRRLELLGQIGIVPDEVIPADIEEKVGKGELPRQATVRLAVEKCEYLAKQHKDALILTADTIVACGRRMLFKPKDDDEVRLHLRMLSGRRHNVLTAIALYVPGEKIRSKLVTTQVQFKHLSDKEIEAYVESKEGLDKAGSYGIQGLAGAFVKRINGSYSSVVGLPLVETKNLLSPFFHIR